MVKPRQPQAFKSVAYCLLSAAHRNFAKRAIFHSAALRKSQEKIFCQTTLQNSILDLRYVTR